MSVKKKKKFQKKTYLEVTCEKDNTQAREIRVSKCTEKAFEYGLVPEVLQFGEFMASSSGTNIRKQESILTLRATY